MIAMMIPLKWDMICATKKKKKKKSMHFSFSFFHAFLKLFHALPFCLFDDDGTLTGVDDRDDDSSKMG